MPKRIVIKIGTNVLTEKLIGLNTTIIKQLTKQIAELHKNKHEIIIITSGAIGAGALELKTKKTRELKTQQALAAIGQSMVMRHYHDAFSQHNINVAQILVTYEDFSDRNKYLNLRNTINKLLELNVIPIINENDPISTKEIGTNFGDNDKMSALVASKVNADTLLMLSDIDGLYDKNPKTNKDAKLIRNVTKITKEIEKAAGKSGSAFAIGGMLTKIKAAKIAMQSGFEMVIANGTKKEAIKNALTGQAGTHFTPAAKLSAKQRFIKFAKERGKIKINECAHDILKEGKVSLLAIGIDSVEGNFKKNDIVKINNIAKGVVDYNADEVKALKGKRNKVIIKSENIVLV
jgi:glutamate 5-kinase|tara:strand:+ start:173 stop:1216 length:1044 start_codon:yes stop_codon:yes gene_type:complete